MKRLWAYLVFHSTSVMLVLLVLMGIALINMIHDSRYFSDIESAILHRSEYVRIIQTHTVHGDEGVYIIFIWGS